MSSTILQGSGFIASNSPKEDGCCLPEDVLSLPEIVFRFPIFKNVEWGFLLSPILQGNRFSISTFLRRQES
ncbi:MAG: hypothetical protein HON98_05070 [Chloroflexi bacterium]|nr:hypothetical protein [Chloroflexota bacterium]MBT3670234.1 hypothetical protein [Chloroflexota bacterium]MBT4004005.1 hypothetical protein [Chloroflexota bacterium]MBT4306092.1 hypothetical protein [Chloroflexota bacterium]MBT4534472.1 hypothetical protein [Chloroflexota bacterium]